MTRSALATPAPRVLIFLVLGALLPMDRSLGAVDGFTSWPKTDSVIRAEGPAIVRIPTAALLLSGLSGGSIQTTLLATPPRAGELVSPTSIQIEIEGSTLLDDGDRSTLEIDVFVYAFAADNSVAGSTSHTVTVDLGHHGAALRQKGLQVLTWMSLPPGQYTVRSLVRKRGTEEFGLAARPVEFLNRATGGPTIRPPWILDSISSWLVAYPIGGSEVERAAIQPLFVDDVAYVPVARPILESGSTVRACFLVGAPDQSSWMLVARFFRQDGEQVGEVPLAVQSRVPSPWPELEAALGWLKVPELPPGRYLVRSALYDSQGLSIESTELAVFIVEPERDQPIAALEVGDEDPPLTVSPSGKRSPRKIPVALRDDIESGYVGVLSLLADGDFGAPKALEQFESHASRLLQDHSLKGLERTEWEFLSKLVGDSIHGLLPVFLLHAGMIRTYGDRGQSPLADHAIRMSSRIVDTFARAAASSADRRDASRALVILAGYFQQEGRMTEGDQILQRALSLDEKNEEALLALAVSYEFQGRYQEALDTMRDLVELRPEHAEGRLRLAVNLARTGETAHARDFFRSLTATDVDEWIAALAVHQLVRLELEAGRIDQALRLLQQAIERWPQRPSFQVELAYLLDREAQPQPAGEMVRSLLANGSSAIGSVHYRYSQRPSPTWLISRRALALQASDHLAELEDLLETRSPALVQ